MRSKFENGTAQNRFLTTPTEHEDIQSNLITVICSIKRNIVFINTNNKMAAPLIAASWLTTVVPKYNQAYTMQPLKFVIV